MTETIIEPSAEKILNDELINTVSTQTVLVVSGYPLRIFDPNISENDRFLEDCEPLVDELIFAPFRVFLQRIPSSGHSNHNERYLSDEGYAAISGYSISGSEVVLGIREALGFNIKEAGNSL